MKLFRIILKNVRRNILRTALTALGTMVLVFVVTLVWSVLDFLNEATRDKTSNFKAVITERWQIPSQMPFAYADGLSRGGARQEGDLTIPPPDSMTWQFFIGNIDPTKKDFNNFVFMFAMEPSKIGTMMDELDTLPAEKKAILDEGIRKMEETPQGVILGKERLALLNKKVGETFKVFGQNYKDINLEFTVVGVIPDGTRYDKNAFMNRDYLNRALDDFPRKNGGKKHPQVNKTLNLVWLRVKDTTEFEKVAGQVVNSPEFLAPAVKVETASSGISNFLEAYSDLLWGMRWLLAPAILATLSLVISNAISISVRERRMEIAVLKVLGFQPWHVLVLVLGEALLIGVVAGGLSSVLTYVVINDVLGGLKFPIAFFAAFFIPNAALWWGVALGGGTAFLGAIVPALSARKVRVAEVFSRVA
jgi:putative ABC transport system permease protein